MLASEISGLNKHINGVTYTPLYEVDQYKPIINSEGNIIDYELIGFKIIKTAVEHYESTLIENIHSLNENEILMSKLMLENANIKQELTSINTKLLDIQNTKGGI